MEQRNREVWRDHSSILEDFTHVLGGIGIGLLLYPALRRNSKPIAWAALLLSTGLHFYADTFKRAEDVTRRIDGRDGRGRLARALRNRGLMRP